MSLQLTWQPTLGYLGELLTRPSILGIYPTVDILTGSPENVLRKANWIKPFRLHGPNGTVTNNPPPTTLVSGLHKPLRLDELIFLKCAHPRCCSCQTQCRSKPHRSWFFTTTRVSSNMIEYVHLNGNPGNGISLTKTGIFLSCKHIITY